MRKVRKLRHWKQRFNPNARFIWRRVTIFAGTAYEAGTEVPEGLLKGAKLRRFWESQRIELYEFEDPNVATGAREQKDELVIPEGVTVTHGKGSWYLIKIVGDEIDYKINGKRAVAEFLAALIATRAENEKLRVAALAAEQQEIKDLITAAGKYANVELTPEKIGEWTEDELAEVELYLEALADDDQETPQEIPTVLGLPTHENPDDDKTASDGGDPDPNKTSGDADDEDGDDGADDRKTALQKTDPNNGDEQ